MRQLCDVSYAFLSRDMTPKDVEKLDRELRADPTAGRASHGTQELMAVMMGLGRGG